MAKTAIKGLAHDPPDCDDERIIASSLMLAIIGRSQVKTPEALNQAVADKDLIVIEKLSATKLSDEQLDILERNALFASYTRASPSVSIAVCTVCDEWIASSSATGRCHMTPKCPGRRDDVIKAKKAKLVPWEDE